VINGQMTIDFRKGLTYPLESLYARSVVEEDGICPDCGAQLNKHKCVACTFEVDQ